MAAKTDEPKTKGVGQLSKAACGNLEGWKEYEASAKALTDARSRSEAAKDKIRTVLLGQLDGHEVEVGEGEKKFKATVNKDNLDFIIGDDGVMRVFINLQAKERTKAGDLSHLFNGSKPGKK